MVSLLPFKAGIDAARAMQPIICADPRTAFLNLLASEGFHPPKVLSIGHIMRFDGPEDKRGKASGWSYYQEIEDSASSGHVIGIASYGDWKAGFQKDWCSRASHQMQPAERAHYYAAREKIKAEYEREQIEKHTQAAKRAYEIWTAQPQATDIHAYLKLKGVKAAHGVKLAKDNRLIIPVAVDNQIVSLQFIDGSGEKRFLTGGKIKGGYFVIEGQSDIIYITEGYATGASVHEATGKTVYIAFNAGNLYEVAGTVKANHSHARIIIAGDDDVLSTGNAGRSKAEQASEGLGIECVFPQGFIDFNDQHQAQGIEQLTRFFNPKRLETYEPKERNSADSVAAPAGVLSDLIDYYHATSGNVQHGFAIQTALGLCSIVLARAYKSSLENYSSLYLLNIGKSGTGKEHARTVIETILLQANSLHLIAGDGYTSGGAVFSTLLDRPRHLTIIDEFGRYLEAGNNLKAGNNHQREANTKLMEAIGRGHSIMRPPSYSSMTLKKDAADAIKNRQIHNPAISLIAMTTPDTFFNTIDMGAIKDGFMNRFIISISDAQRTVRRHKPAVAVPDRIVRWINDVSARSDKIHTAADPAEAIVLEFTNDANECQEQFQEYLIEKGLYLEKFGMDELIGRSNEMAMKISLICALSENAKATEIELRHMQWGVEYIKHCLEKTIDKLKISVSHSDFEHQKKEILNDLRGRGVNGITWAQMQKVPPYSQHKPKDLKEIMQSLKDADLAGDEPYVHPNGGRPTILWRALK